MDIWNFKGRKHSALRTARPKWNQVWWHPRFQGPLCASCAFTWSFSEVFRACSLKAFLKQPFTVNLGYKCVFLGFFKNLFFIWMIAFVSFNHSVEACSGASCHECPPAQVRHYSNSTSVPVIFLFSNNIHDKHTPQLSPLVRTLDWLYLHNKCTKIKCLLLWCYHWFALGVFNATIWIQQIDSLLLLSYIYHWA